MMWKKLVPTSLEQEESLRTFYPCETNSQEQHKNTQEARKTKKEYWNQVGIEEGANSVWVR
jgi:hypothetical protein